MALKTGLGETETPQNHQPSPPKHTPTNQNRHSVKRVHLLSKGGLRLGSLPSNQMAWVKPRLCETVQRPQEVRTQARLPHSLI